MLSALKKSSFPNLEARFAKHVLHFKVPSGTSRGVMTEKPTWYLFVKDTASGIEAVGECSPLPGLSVDDLNYYERVLQKVCREINDYQTLLNTKLMGFPSIKFGLECALLNLANGGEHILFPSAFTHGSEAITINGLVWMGTPEYMQLQVKDKLDKGFRCIKLKIGAIDFDTELALLQSIRDKYVKEEIEIRVDANGGFSPIDAMQKLEQLARLDIHSIEQPIPSRQWDLMAELCMNTPLPIALDEELIGIDTDEYELLLNTIKPQYLILKPSMLGGMDNCERWIKLATERNIGWWATSALESNVGLNAIAQWVFMQQSLMPQGLGTGQLYTNNIACPLELHGDQLQYTPTKAWGEVSI